MTIMNSGRQYVKPTYFARDRVRICQAVTILRTSEGLLCIQHELVCQQAQACEIIFRTLLRFLPYLQSATYSRSVNNCVL